MKLTVREQEILNFIKRNPMASQDEIASTFSITRSSVAVHISNLMKKKAILGKGYIFNKASRERVLLFSNLKQIPEKKELSSISDYCHDLSQRIIYSLENHGIDVNVVLFENIGDENNSPMDVDYLRIGDNFVFSLQKVFERDFITEKIHSLASSDRKLWTIIDPELISSSLIADITDDESSIMNLCSAMYCHDLDEAKVLSLPLNTLLIICENLISAEKISRYIGRKDVAQKLIVGDREGQLFCIEEKSIQEIPFSLKRKLNLKKSMPVVFAALVFALVSGYSLRQAARMAVGTALKSEDDYR